MPAKRRSPVRLTLTVLQAAIGSDTLASYVEDRENVEGVRDYLNRTRNDGTP